MSNISVRRAKELEDTTKQVVQQLLGRPLQEDEDVAVLAFPHRAAPPPAERQQGSARMDRILDKSADAMRDVSEQDFDAALDEAIGEERKRDT